MKRFLLPALCAITLFYVPAFAQIGISASGASPDASSMLDVVSTTKGMLIPRMTSAERDAISNPAFGLQIVNTQSGCINIYNGAGWAQICGQCINPPVLTAGSNSPACEGGPINLTATTISGVIYSWTGPNGFSSSLQNPTIASATFADAGTYEVSTTGNSCNSLTAQVSVDVYPVLVANAGPDQTNTPGTSTSLAGNTPSVGSGTWAILSGSGGSLTNASNPTTTFSGTMGGTYLLSWTISNSCGTSADSVTINFANQLSYINGNEAYWTEKDNGYRDVTIGGGSTVYSWDATNKQYRDGNTILIPNLVSTPDGATANATSFYGFSGGSASDANYQWDGLTNSSVSQPSNFDKSKMFISPLSSGTMNYCKALQNNNATSCNSGSSNVIIDGPNTTLAYASYTPVSGTHAVYNASEMISIGVVTASLPDYVSQQQLDATANKSYCVATYGKGWRMPTDIEIGHTNDEYGATGCNPGYAGQSSSDRWIWSSSRFYNSGQTSGQYRWRLNINSTGGTPLWWYNYGTSDISSTHGVRCVYPPY